MIKMLFDGYYKMFEEEQPDGYKISWSSRNSVPFKVKPKTDCVTVIALRPTDWTVAVLRQFRPTIGDYLYEFPAGKVDAGETPMQAAKRELFEETGLEFTTEDDGENECETPMVFPSAGMIDECHSIVIGFCEGEPNTNNVTEHEQIEVQMMSVKELLKLLESNKYISLGVAMYITGLQSTLMRNIIQ